MRASRDAYRQFLSSADLQGWLECLGTYDEVLDGERPVRADETGAGLEALCMAIYVMWLSSLCAERAIQKRSETCAAQLGPRLLRAPGQGTPRLRTLTEAVIAASKGYHRTGRALIEPLEPGPPIEIALLFMPDRPAARAAELKPYVYAHGAGHFLPAIYFYARALLDLGYLEDVRGLVARHGQAAPNALLIDLEGQLHELAGSWREARAAYRQSNWATHRYRAAICDVILGEGTDAIDASGDPEKLAAGMLAGGVEIDRAGLARTVSFVNACRWNDFDNWLVSFELGRLCFQRRQHAEAEGHFKVATQQAPRAFRFTIESLRYSNLTWLSGRSLVRELDLLPELLECGLAALDAEGGEQDKAYIRTSMAAVTHEPDVLEPVTEHGDAYQRGLANQIRGETPSAIEDWCACLREGYHPRAIHELVKVFAGYGFERMAHALTAIIIRESWDDFFQLWELTDVLGGILEGSPAGRLDAGLLVAQLAELEARVEELVESEFQNAIRAFELFARRRRPDKARAMLARAEKLAEGPEEYLQLAIARRKTAGGGWDRLGVGLLLRAERESRDRLERLQIARELVRCNRIARARSILHAEGVLSERLELTPIEYVVALQCGQPCLSAEEFERLGRMAEAALQRDEAAGRWRRYAERFARRLREHAEKSALSFAAAAPDGAAGDDDESMWRALRSELERLRESRQPELERRRLRQRVLELEAPNASHFARYSLWGWLYDEFGSLLKWTARLRPDVPDGQTPISRSVPAVRIRRQALAALWRQYLLSDDPVGGEPRLDAVRRFLNEERELEAGWERARRAEMAEPVTRLRYLADTAGRLLNAIRSDEEEGRSRWAFFLGVGNAVVEDTQWLTEQLDARIASVAQG